MRRILVVAQIALSLVLLVGALLFERSLRNLTAVDTGMTPARVLVADVDVRLLKLEPARRAVVFQEMRERIAAQPGVSAVSAVFLSLFSGSGWNGTVWPDAGAQASGQESWFHRVGPAYFHTLQTPVLAGRGGSRLWRSRTPARRRPRDRDRRRLWRVPLRRVSPVWLVSCP